jgi:hypothetical protein
MAVETHPNEAVEHADQQTTTSLVTGIVKDAQELMKQHVQLLQVEVEDDLRATTQAGITLAIGTATALVGAVLLAMCLVELLKLAGMAPWAAYGLLGAIVAGVGGVLVAGALTAFSKINPLPEKSVEEVKEDLGWQTKPK